MKRELEKMLRTPRKELDQLASSIIEQQKQ
jgi:hypothetical protein